MSDPPAPVPPHRFGEVVFDFTVAGAASPLADADELARLARRNLLPAIEAACDAVGALGDVSTTGIAIDLGDLPEPVDWPALARDLARRLEAELARHLIAAPAGGDLRPATPAAGGPSALLSPPQRGGLSGFADGAAHFADRQTEPSSDAPWRGRSTRPGAGWDALPDVIPENRTAGADASRRERPSAPALSPDGLLQEPGAGAPDAYRHGGDPEPVLSRSVGPDAAAVPARADATILADIATDDLPEHLAALLATGGSAALVKRIVARMTASGEPGGDLTGQQAQLRGPDGARNARGADPSAAREAAGNRRIDTDGQPTSAGEPPLPGPGASFSAARTADETQASPSRPAPPDPPSEPHRLHQDAGAPLARPVTTAPELPQANQAPAADPRPPDTDLHPPTDVTAGASAPVTASDDVLNGAHSADWPPGPLGSEWSSQVPATRVAPESKPHFDPAALAARFARADDADPTAPKPPIDAADTRRAAAPRPVLPHAHPVQAAHGGAGGGDVKAPDEPQAFPDAPPPGRPPATGDAAGSPVLDAAAPPIPGPRSISDEPGSAGGAVGVGTHPGKVRDELPPDQPQLPEGAAGPSVGEDAVAPTVPPQRIPTGASSVGGAVEARAGQAGDRASPHRPHASEETAEPPAGQDASAPPPSSPRGVSTEPGDAPAPGTELGNVRDALPADRPPASEGAAGPAAVRETVPVPDLGPRLSADPDGAYGTFKAPAEAGPVTPLQDGPPAPEHAAGPTIGDRAGAPPSAIPGPVAVEATDASGDEPPAVTSPAWATLAGTPGFPAGSDVGTSAFTSNAGAGGGQGRPGKGRPSGGGPGPTSHSTRSSDPPPVLPPTARRPPHRSTVAAQSPSGPEANQTAEESTRGPARAATPGPAPTPKPSSAAAPPEPGLRDAMSAVAALSGLPPGPPSSPASGATEAATSSEASRGASPGPVEGNVSRAPARPPEAPPGLTMGALQDAHVPHPRGNRGPVESSGQAFRRDAAASARTDTLPAGASAAERDGSETDLPISATGTGAAARDRARNGQDPEPAAPTPDAALPEPGRVLLAAWREDRAMFARSIRGRTPAQLINLIAAILIRRDAPVPPLVAAARGAAGRASEPAALLRGVLLRIVDDLPVDLEDPALAEEAPALPRPAGGVAGDAGRSATAGEEAGETPVPGLAAPPEPDLAQVAARLAAPRDFPRRVTEFVAASDQAGRQRLLAHLQPGFPERELVALTLLWDALPDSLVRTDPQRDALWQFALLLALGHVRRGGGTAGLVAPAVAHLVEGAEAGRTLARALLDRLDETRPRHAPAAAAQLAAGLRSLLAASPAAAAIAAEAEGPQTTRTAGLVLVAVYLPMLFDRLAITERGKFPDPEAAERAMDVLQAITHGDRQVPRGPRPLERLLCAIPPDRPLQPRRPLAPPEADLVDGLLRTVIERWSALGGTSVEGLREAFLQRDGLLRHTADGLALEVAPRAYDMLLDRLPWSMSVIKLSWMPAPIHVTWRK